jgi:hypothetical protein
MIIETLRHMWVISLGESIVIEGILGIAHLNILGGKPIKLPTVWHSWPMMSPIEFG